MKRKEVSIKKPKHLGSLFSKTIKEKEAGAKEVAIDDICLPARQPRRVIVASSLESLAESIKLYGVLEPLLVRRLEETIELISGERRLRSAKLAGLTQVPVIFIEADDQKAREIRVVENLQREDLTALDETEAILELIALRLDLTCEEVCLLLQRMLQAKKRSSGSETEYKELPVITDVFIKVGRMTWESFTRNRIPILRLPEDLLVYIRKGELDYSKAVIINKIKNPCDRHTIIVEVIENKLNKTETRIRVKNFFMPEYPEYIPERMERIRSSAAHVMRRLRSPGALPSDNGRMEKIEELLRQIEGLM